MSNWNWHSLKMEDKIRVILQDFQTYPPDHMGTVFASTYQIALQLDEDTLQKINKPIGGSGTGVHHSVSQYIARELSQRISRGEIKDIEGGWLVRAHIKDIQFQDGDREFSPTGGNKDVILSMFRLKPE